MSDGIGPEPCPPEHLTADPDTMSSQCVRALQEENERLRAEVADTDRAMLELAAYTDEKEDLYRAAMKRIDTALALHRPVNIPDALGAEEGQVYCSECSRVADGEYAAKWPCETVKILRGHKS